MLTDMFGWQIGKLNTGNHSTEAEMVHRVNRMNRGLYEETKGING